MKNSILEKYGVKSKYFNNDEDEAEAKAAVPTVSRKNAVLEKYGVKSKYFNNGDEDEGRYKYDTPSLSELPERETEVRSAETSPVLKYAPISKKTVSPSEAMSSARDKRRVSELEANKAAAKMSAETEARRQLLDTAKNGTPERAVELSTPQSAMKAADERANRARAKANAEAQAGRQLFETAKGISDAGKEKRAKEAEQKYMSARESYDALYAPMDREGQSTPEKEAAKAEYERLYDEWGRASKLAYPNTRKLGKAAMGAGRAFFEGGGNEALSGIAGAVAMVDDVLSEVMNAALDFGDIALSETLGTKYSGKFSPESTKNITSQWRDISRDHSNWASQVLSETTEGHSPLQKKIITVAQEAGNMVGTSGMTGAMALSGVYKNATKLAISAGASGGSYIDALNSGAGVGNAAAYALLSGATEYATESLFGGNPLVDADAGLVSKAAKKLGANKKLLSFLASQPVELLNEGLEEVISEALGPVWQRLTYDPDADWATMEQLIDAGVNGVLLAGGMTGGSAIINAADSAIAQKKAGIKAEKDYAGALREADSVKALVHEGLAADEGSRAFKLATRLNAALEAGKTLSDQQITSLVKANETAKLSGALKNGGNAPALIAIAREHDATAGAAESLSRAETVTDEDFARLYSAVAEEYEKSGRPASELGADINRIVMAETAPAENKTAVSGEAAAENEAYENKEGSAAPPASRSSENANDSTGRYSDHASQDNVSQPGEDVNPSEKPAAAENIHEKAGRPASELGADINRIVMAETATAENKTAVSGEAAAENEAYENKEGSAAPPASRSSENANDSAGRYSDHASQDNVSQPGEDVNPSEKPAAAENIRLTKDDAGGYMQTGSTKHIRDAKARATAGGTSLILTSEAQVRAYIHAAIEDRTSRPTVGYGKIGERMAEDIKTTSEGRADVTGWYLELNASDIAHIYEGHSTAKRKGDIPLSKDDILSIADYIDTYDDVLAYNEHKNGDRTITIGKKINGHAVIVELLSRQRQSIHPKTMWGMETAEYEKKYKKLVSDTPDTDVAARSRSTGQSPPGNHVQDAGAVADTANISQPAPAVNPTATETGAAAAPAAEAASNEPGAGQITPEKKTGIQGDLTPPAETRKGENNNGKEKISDSGRGGLYAERAGGEAGILSQKPQKGRSSVKQQGTAIRRGNSLADLRLPQVSTHELGVRRGNRNKAVTEYPRGTWDEAMKGTAARAAELGYETRFFSGMLQIGGDADFGLANGTVQGKTVFLRADDMKYSADQILDHELWHEMSAQTPGLVAAISERLRETYTADEFRKITDKYIEKYRALYDGYKGMSMEEVESLILDEIFADAYAGMNRFSGEALKYTDAVRSELKNRTGRDYAQPMAGEAAGRYSGEDAEEEYSYASLVRKPPLKVAWVKKGQSIKLSNGAIDSGDIFKKVIANCEKITTKSEIPTYAVKVPALDGYVEITHKGVRHGYQKGLRTNREAPPAYALATARAELALPEVLKNSIAVNEMNVRGNADVIKSVVLLGVAGVEQERGNDYYAVRSVVEIRKNQNPILKDFGVVGRLYASNAKKMSDANVRDAGKTGVALAHASLTEINIAEVLNSVKGVFDDTLSSDVYSHLGEKRKDTSFSEGLRYSAAEDDVREIDKKRTAGGDVPSTVSGRGSHTSRSSSGDNVS